MPRSGEAPGGAQGAPEGLAEGASVPDYPGSNRCDGAMAKRRNDRILALQQAGPSHED
jgi:hypothetical protein